MNFIKRAQTYLLIVLVFFGLSVAVFANALSISVDQTSVAFDMDEQESQKFIIKVKNTSDTGQEISVSAMDYVIGDNNELTLSNDNDVNSGIKDWIETEDKDFFLSADESRDVIFKVNAPENASIGSHRGAVLFRVVPDVSDTLEVQGQVGVHVLINIKGDTHASGKINRFDIPILASDDVAYNAEFENTGNIHYVPYGEVAVHNIFTNSEQIYQYDKHFVFPEKKFNFVITKEIPSNFGLYKVQVTFVDGEGVSHSKSDYTMGIFFPVIIVGIVIFTSFMIQIFRQKKKKQKKSGKKDKNKKTDKKQQKKSENNDKKDKENKEKSIEEKIRVEDNKQQEQEQVEVNEEKGVTVKVEDKKVEDEEKLENDKKQFEDNSEENTEKEKKINVNVE